MMKLAAAVVAFCLGVGSEAGAQPAAETGAATNAVVENTMAQRMQACALCHGKEGRATNAGYFPRIAGKPAGYLFNQLKNFQEGRRRNETMNHLVEHMSDAYLHDIAGYFAELDLPYPPARALRLTQDEQTVAQTLLFEGSPGRRIPACASCHGADLAGRLPAMPGLKTLPADYLIAQLGAWRTGLRKAAAPDCMAEVAQRLTPDEVAALGRWLSAQTLPTGTKPATRGSDPLPIRCGSVER